ncbi:MAG: hypothetical protein ABWZ79_05970 [Pedobacter agri]
MAKIVDRTIGIRKKDLEVAKKNLIKMAKLLVSKASQKKYQGPFLNQEMKKTAVKMNNWRKFIEQYKKHEVIDMKKASKLYKTWKDSYVGGSVLSSINEFLYKHFAKPIGRAISNRLTRGY